MMAEDMAQKKLRGSGGYAIAMITEEEQKKGNLGGPELFLAGVGRLEDDRFVKYYCNKCEKEYTGSPSVIYDNPNEELGEGVTLVEKGEYKCKTCNATIANYRKFETQVSSPQQQTATTALPLEAPVSEQKEVRQPAQATTQAVGESGSDGFTTIQSLVGMSAYDSEAMLIGTVEEVGLRRSSRGVQVTIKVAGREVPWSGISKIGDILLLSSLSSGGSSSTSQQSTGSAVGGRCSACGFQNEAGSIYCEQCGTKI